MKNITCFDCVRHLVHEECKHKWTEDKNFLCYFRCTDTMKLG